ncbi:hypothetical protein KVR01_001097 [Diaporthe batatas]|uniref:uncharacterized protein n=1 Tax=Diaporthe batatas TaxID=748121 RepID=UPI001D04B507|nr:uncharacterized protein KVR01_001097 [Diaporthe batatas]KAG8168348.1 hypothetical protein KVR01_001097 [Diaporthe batatas]
MDSLPFRPDRNGNEPQNTKTKFRKTNIDALEEPHRNVIVSTVSKILSTEIAKTTYTQIVDGLPLPEVLRDVYGDLISPDHPVHQHAQLKHGALNTVCRLHDEFDPNILQFDVPDDFHGNLWWQFNRDGAPVTLFRHPWYRDHMQYPHGAADVVGYWAENRVLGGVVLFDRKTEMTESSAGTAGSDAVYIHPDRQEVTYRICLLTDAQKKVLLDFLLDVPGTGRSGPVKETDACPLPILPDETNVQRVDPEEPIRYTGVYRDQWERRMPPPEWLGDGRGSCVYNPLDFPTKTDQRDAMARFRSKGDRRGNDDDDDDE